LPRKKSRKSARKRQAKIAPPRRVRTKKPPRPTRLKVKIPKIPKRPRFVTTTKAGTRDLSRAIRYLRAIGLTKSKSRKKKAQRAIVTKFENVLRGRATVMEFSKKDAEGYRRSGYQKVGKKIIVPKEKGIKKRKRGRWIEQRRQVEFGEIIILATPFSYADLQTRLDELQNDPEIKLLLKKGWRLTLRYFGNYAYATMANFDLLREYLERYNIESDDKKVENLELMIILTSPGYNIPSEIDRKAQRRRNRGSHHDKYSPTKYQRWKKRNPAGYQRHLKSVRKAMRKYRKRLKRKK
jgi:hypothetical protein